ncbi:MAG: spondin domain-containing protein, partial [Anaerolineae bacterium]|nr:spondin domain-containing protein [Anaerolineae bacterium]
MEEEAMSDDEMMEDDMMDDDAMPDGEMMEDGMMEDDMMDDDMMAPTTFTVRIENISSDAAWLLAPGLWAVHQTGSPLFSAGQADRGAGLEGLAEDGNPATLLDALIGLAEVVQAGVFNTPVGAGEPGVLAPGGVYEFTFSASPHNYLSFASMFVQSNDLFYAPADTGIALFDEEGNPLSGDITALVFLWDAGTEVNQEPGIGPDQAPRQTGANSGADESGVVQLVADGYSYPSSVIAITITPGG